MCRGRTSDPAPRAVRHPAGRAGRRLVGALGS
jgi:hypothetical protein